jgi:Ca2+-binding RTX toxin-like protein
MVFNFSLYLDLENYIPSSTDYNTIKVSATSVNGNGSVNGSIGDDVLLGGDGKDTLSGNDGDDLIVGGAEDDLLTGGEGEDRFYFETPNEGIDTITDFNVSEDLIEVSGQNFGSDLVVGDVIDSTQFRIGSAAADSSDRFIYNSSDGALFFDADGNGSLAPIQIATLTIGLELTHENISVV